MARGWESKSVEDQIGEAQARKERLSQPVLSTSERARRERKQSLELSRSQILTRLKAAGSKRYRAQLQVALDHLEDELRKLESE
jgi:hypothetical protein